MNKNPTDYNDLLAHILLLFFRYYIIINWIWRAENDDNKSRYLLIGEQMEMSNANQICFWEFIHSEYAERLLRTFEAKKCSQPQLVPVCLTYWFCKYFNSWPQ